MQVAADTSALLRSVDESNAKLDEFSSHAVGTIAEGTAIGDAFAHAGEKILSIAVDAVKQLTEALVTLTMQGSHVGDVEAGFERLTTRAGLLGEHLMGTLRSGTHGTIDDFALMKQVNQDLAAGLKLTDDQFGLLSQGAFALAKVTGGDAASALETMNNAMVTGRVKAIALLTGKVDLQTAESAFADALGVTAKELTAEGKLEADREAILHAVQAALARVGDQHDSLADKVAKGRVWWANFEDALGKTLATSPVLTVAIDALGKALMTAFGSDREAAIQHIASAINHLAILVADAGIAISAILSKMIIDIDLQVSALAKIPVIGSQFAGLVTALDSAALTSIKVGAALNQTRDAMVAAAASAGTLTKNVNDSAAAHQAAGDAAQDHGKWVKDLNETTKKYAAAWEQLNSVGTTYLDTIQLINPKILEQVAYYLRAGFAIKTVAEAYPMLTEAQVAGIDTFVKKTDAGTLEAEKSWIEYDTLIASHGQTAMETQIAAIDKWALDLEVKAQQAGTDTIQFYDALAAAWTAKLNGIAVNWKSINDELTNHTKAGLQQQADVAKNTFQAALTHVGEFTDQQIQKFRDLADAAQEAADRFGMDMGGALDTVTAKANGATAAIKALNNAQVDLTKGAFAMPTSDSLTKAGIIQSAVNFGADPTPWWDKLPKHALGGHMAAGEAGIVGDAGAELWVPDTGGTVIPHGNGGGDTITVHVTMSGLVDPALADKIAATVGPAILRRSGRKFGSV